MRYYSCQALSRLKDEDSADMIAPLLGDPAGQVRVAVVEALAQLRGAKALEALHRAAAGAEPDVQRAALLGLGHVRDVRSLPVIRQALDGSDRDATRRRLGDLRVRPAGDCIQSGRGIVGRRRERA